MPFPVLLTVLTVDVLTLILTFLMPTESTTLSVIPIVLTATVEIYKNVQQSRKLLKVISCICAAVSACFILYCFVLTYACNMEGAGHQIFFVFKPDTILDKITISYHAFWIPAFSWCFLLLLVSTIESGLSQKTKQKQKEKSLHQLLFSE